VVHQNQKFKRTFCGRKLNATVFWDRKGVQLVAAWIQEHQSHWKYNVRH
jgi:hypothetical protein